jgi:hypothetical protein
MRGSFFFLCSLGVIDKVHLQTPASLNPTSFG